MSQEETFGSRDLTYSAWHRRNSTQRFVGIERAQQLAMIDVDVALWVEYDDEDKVPIALIETARDIGQEHKTCTIMQALAKMANLAALVVLYKHAATPNPAYPTAVDIASFRIKRLHPKPDAEWRTLTPGQYANALLNMRAFGAHELDELWRQKETPVASRRPVAVMVEREVTAAVNCTAANPGSAKLQR